ncbi:MAG: serine/threonine-protein phosphatase [Actinobacteria bacterium]|nr:serine/threonine-protein phosphatase [Actinomycetota bacterium]
MSRIGRLLIIISTLAFTIVVGYIDVVTGLIPDLTVLYLVPIIAGTIFIGLSYGLIVAMIAAIAEFTSNVQLGIGIDISLITDAILHLLIFLLGVILTDRLLTQLRVITEFEQKRSYDIDLAKEIHGSVFTPFPAEYGDLTIGTKLAFARELGGDYYHFSGLNDRLFFCIADISGKGIAAALFSALLHQNIIDALKHSDDLADIVAVVNSRMHAALPDNMFITLFCSLIRGEAISFINAGHEPPLLYSRQQNSVKLLESRTTLPIGIQPDLRIEPEIEAFNSGDILLAVTDGVTESATFLDSPFKKLETLLRENSDASPQYIADIIYNRANPDGLEQPSDDIIIACIKRQV